MRAACVLLALAANLAACGFLFGHPQWCGAVGSGGPAVLPPATPRPIVTPDPGQLLCISVENRSEVDMSLNETTDGTLGWSLIAACSGMTMSTAIPTGSWGLEIGPAADGEMARPVLASFDSSQLAGEPPYLIAVIIRPDLTTTIEQRNMLGDAASDSC